MYVVVPRILGCDFEMFIICLPVSVPVFGIFFVNFPYLEE